MKKRVVVSILLLLFAYVGLNAAAGNDKYSEYENPDLLISVETAKHLMETQDDVSVVDVLRPEQYEEGHISGAVNVWRPDYGADSEEYDFKGMRGSAEKVYGTLGNLGITGNTTLLVYSHSNCHDAYRFSWVVRMYGHPINKIRESRLATLEDVDLALDDPDTIIIDTRTSLEYMGIAQYAGAFRKGHIPGAIHINFTENFTEEGFVKPASELRALYEESGITPDKSIITYCQSGVRCTMTSIRLAEGLGYPDVSNYDGSWIEGFGMLGPVVFILLFIAACLFFLPGAPFGIIAGIVFGPIMGTIWASVGSTIGASLAFLVARYVARGFAEKLIEKNLKLKKIDDGVNKHGWRMLMITRFVPIFPFNVQNYVYGLTKIPFVKYAVLSWVFMLPGTMAYVFIAGAAVSGANLGTIMMYFAIGAVLLVALSFVPKILKKKSQTTDLIEE